MDNSVPMGGIKTARILPLHDKFNAIPVVLALPPNKDEARGVIEEAQDAGVSHFLMKPFTLNSLQKRVEEVLAIDEPVEKHPYAKRLQKSVEEIVENQKDIVSQCDSILGANSDED